MGRTVQCNGRINPELMDIFREYCHEKGISQNNGMEEAFRSLIKAKKDDSSFSNAQSEMETIQKCLGIISENCKILAQRLETETLLNSEEHKKAVSDMEEKIKEKEETIRKHEEALKASEHTIEDLKKQVDSEMERARLCEREKDIAIREKTNLQETYTIKQEKMAGLKDQTKKIKKLECENEELKKSIQQAYNTISTLSKAKADDIK